MNETYTRKQAMERLGVKSTGAFRLMAKSYPEAFVIVTQGTAVNKHPRYDKAALDDFAKKREYFMQGTNREHS